ncbi:hypothetical protein AAES_49998 [Amazona aestiva]|uniref:Uncharacterized protein n=1 Tax=Amazona aestiva TaxID=12930 RepID=A0A0Q3UTT2_AMAAE|nr:hypothetical protein AAES_49998 [Amazona aestiva]
MAQASNSSTGMARRVVVANAGATQAMGTTNSVARASSHSSSSSALATSSWVASTSPVTRDVTAPAPSARSDNRSRCRTAAKTRPWRCPKTRLKVSMKVASQMNSVMALG